jgi:hypothetical protein
MDPPQGVGERRIIELCEEAGCPIASMPPVRERSGELLLDDRV